MASKLYCTCTTELDILVTSLINSYFIYSRPDRYVPLFGEYFYDPAKWRESVPFAEQLRGFQELIDQGKVPFYSFRNAF